MHSTKLLTFIKKNNPNGGLSLIELLLASSLTALVLSIAGWGLVHILATDQKASAKGRIQFNANRASEFLSDEIRLARKIESDSVAALAEAPDFDLPAGAKPIIVLQIPRIPQRVIYSIRPIKEGDIWDGPIVIERWGPSFNKEGQYKEDEINQPDIWQSHVLVDSINDEVATANCPPDWQVSHVDSPSGFHACVDSQEKLVKFHLATTVDNPTWRQEINYKVSTTAFARSRITQGFTEEESAFTVINKKLTLEKPANVKFEVLGGQIVCSEGNVPVTTNVYIDADKQTWDSKSSLTLREQAAGTTFDVESIAGNGSMCGGHYETVSTSYANTSQLEVLVNGDLVPDHTPYGGQNTIESFMQQYVKDGKINIAENQVIYLFELWGDDQSQTYFDLQDNVVLATVDSTN
ncbi:hypothetical protein [Crocosphaera sp.]|uniref:hypothetical protein n=1 Tax=Crocosphaera sp. TaxID=2729996 RepID=UPI003F1E8708